MDSNSELVLYVIGDGNLSMPKEMRMDAELVNVAGESGLKCPICDCKFLHQEGVDVYCRRNSTHINFDYSDGNVQTDTSMDENPSKRRDGIKIYYSCEFCCHFLDHDPHDHEPILELNIIQHKGNEYVHWTFVDESIVPELGSRFTYYEVETMSDLDRSESSSWEDELSQSREE